MNLINDKQRLTILTSHISLAILELDLKGKILSANDLSVELLESHSLSDILQKDFFSYFKTPDIKRMRTFFQKALEGETVKFDFEHISHLGKSTFVLQFIPVKENGQKINYIMTLCQDVSHIKKTEHLLFETQKKYRSVIDNIPDLLFEIDTEANVLFSNRALPGYSWDKTIGASFLDFIDDASQKNILKKSLKHVIKSNTPQEFEIDTHLLLKELVNWNCRITPMLENGKINRLVLLIQDITEKKRIESEKQHILEQLFQSQKLESLGRLAGGVAHEFNNLLAIILLHGTLLERQIKNNSDAKESLNVITKSAERAEELTAQLLGFARKGKYGAKPIPINPILEEAVNLINTSFAQNSKIKITMDLATNLPQIMASETQILQCIMNLGLNAVDAMPKGGKLHIKTYFQNQLLIEDKNIECVCVDMTDTGTGIAPEHLTQIFDPFFTTKDIGKGTGLGLSMIYGIMENHGGRVSVQSTLNQGSRFTLAFPALIGEHPHEKAKNSHRRR